MIVAALYSYAFVLWRESERAVRRSAVLICRCLPASAKPFPSPIPFSFFLPSMEVPAEKGAVLLLPTSDVKKGFGLCVKRRRESVPFCGVPVGYTYDRATPRRWCRAWADSVVAGVQFPSVPTSKEKETTAEGDDVLPSPFS